MPRSPYRLFRLYQGAGLSSGLAKNIGQTGAYSSSLIGQQAQERRRGELLAQAVKQGKLQASGLSSTDSALAGRYMDSVKKPDEGPGILSGIGGFFGNLGSDIWETTKGLPASLVETASAVGSDVAGAIIPGVKTPVGMVHADPGVKGSDVKQRIVDPTVDAYKYLYAGTGAPEGSSFWERAYEHPLQPILDVATVASLGTGTAARAGLVPALTRTAGRRPLSLGEGTTIPRDYSARPLHNIAQRAIDPLEGAIKPFGDFRASRGMKRMQREEAGREASAESAAVRHAIQPLVETSKDLSYEEGIALDYALRGWNTPEQIQATREMYQASLRGENPEGANIADFEKVFHTPEDARKFVEYKANLPAEVENLILNPTQRMIEASLERKSAVETGFERSGVPEEERQARIQRPRNILAEFMNRRNPPDEPPPPEVPPEGPPPPSAPEGPTPRGFTRVEDAFPEGGRPDSLEEFLEWQDIDPDVVDPDDLAVMRAYWDQGYLPPDDIFIPYMPDMEIRMADEEAGDVEEVPEVPDTANDLFEQWGMPDEMETPEFPDTPGAFFAQYGEPEGNTPSPGGPQSPDELPTERDITVPYGTPEYREQMSQQFQELQNFMEQKYGDVANFADNASQAEKDALIRWLARSERTGDLQTPYEEMAFLDPDRLPPEAWDDMRAATTDATSEELARWGEPMEGEARDPSYPEDAPDYYLQWDGYLGWMSDNLHDALKDGGWLWGNLPWTQMFREAAGNEERGDWDPSEGADVPEVPDTADELLSQMGDTRPPDDPERSLFDQQEGTGEINPPIPPSMGPPETTGGFGEQGHPIEPTWVPDQPARGFKQEKLGLLARLGGEVPEGRFVRGRRDRRISASGVTAGNMFETTGDAYLREAGPEVLMSGAARMDPKNFVEHVARRERDVIAQAFDQQIITQVAAVDPEKGEPRRFTNQREVEQALGPDWVLVHDQFPIRWFVGETEFLRDTINKLQEMQDMGIATTDENVLSELNHLASDHAQEFVRKSFGAKKIDGVAVPRDFFEYQKRIVQVSDPFDHPAARAYARYIHTWRSLTLAYMPRWAINTAIGSFLMNMVKGVGFRGEYGVAKKLRNRSPQEFPEENWFATPEAGGVELGSLTGMDYLEPGMHGVGGAIERQTGAKVTGFGQRIVERVQQIEDYFRRASFVHSLDRASKQRMGEMGTVLENLEKRKGNIRDEDFINQVLQDPQLVKAAVDDLNRFSYNFAALGPYERRYVRLAIPFWGWYKFISKLAYRLPVEYPGRTNIMANLGMLGNMTQEEYGQFPEWMRGFIPAGQNDKGELTYFSSLGVNPLGSFFNPFGKQGLVQGAVSVGQASPPIQAGLSALGVDTLRGGVVPISPEEGIGSDFFGSWIDVNKGEETSPMVEGAARRFGMGFLRATPQFRMAEERLAGGRPVYPESVPFIRERPMPIREGTRRNTDILSSAAQMTGIFPKHFDLRAYQRLLPERVKYARARNKTQRRKLRRLYKNP